MGFRKKIILAFTSLGLLLFFTGLVSMFELQRLSKTTQNLLDASARNMDLSKRLIDAAQDQNTAILQMMVTDNRDYDSLYHIGKEKFDHVLAEITVTVKDRSELDSVYIASEEYEKIASQYVNMEYDEGWFLNVYRPSYIHLTSAIKNYMTSSQNSLAMQASQLENNAYRAITPGVIALAAAILILLMFFYLLDLYYIRPVMNITKGLDGYFSSAKVPFHVKLEGKDEVSRLKEHIDSLIAQVKKQEK